MVQVLDFRRSRKNNCAIKLQWLIRRDIDIFAIIWEPQYNHREGLQTEQLALWSSQISPPSHIWTQRWCWVRWRYFPLPGIVLKLGIFQAQRETNKYGYLLWVANRFCSCYPSTNEVFQHWNRKFGVILTLYSRKINYLH